MGDWSDEALGIVDLDEDVEACDDSFYLSEPYLRQLAGNEDLDAVSYMELTVDSSQTTLGELGQVMALCAQGVPACLACTVLGGGGRKPGAAG
mmetsp:Transcript_1015/g.3914  ORF Transcript_1015/g.3914 Transcript_1015/m.3914 type:complete len:93 (-) Transcript_1015:404-682(-)